ncbi:hypothetical protein RRG49_03640 [Mycoplasmopsis felis]|uniref:hypothetical protein n=2 Tax=Mycoplasmopsis felis TaxID=33923 RepID=UPI0021AEA254|nr:hypothetical protein [Mycoplasmopsis felis]MCU9931257.1 hypothetical protein [Mycoplasmopsis felis]MCU9937484.1 hypothetical protein [Mycoplasmopsis felis]UWV78055.1 hypothetical protein NWE59_03750 [Mycoplasmopsis felis]UWV84215.1 hypothetical protein NWE58_01725 [Mycoplasmopsis felis]UWW00819.1 hypothetical protein NW064_06615 [Mycoplasmopsis felis]
MSKQAKKWIILIFIYLLIFISFSTTHLFLFWSKTVSSTLFSINIIFVSIIIYLLNNNVYNKTKEYKHRKENNILKIILIISMIISTILIIIGIIGFVLLILEGERKYAIMSLYSIAFGFICPIIVKIVYSEKLPYEKNKFMKKLFTFEK